jgi:hypothetical protein
MHSWCAYLYCIARIEFAAEGIDSYSYFFSSSC